MKNDSARDLEKEETSARIMVNCRLQVGGKLERPVPSSEARAPNKWVIVDVSCKRSWSDIRHRPGSIRVLGKRRKVTRHQIFSGANVRNNSTGLASHDYARLATPRDFRRLRHAEIIRDT